jgi:uncharacterized protein (TIGR03546 family)
MLILIWIRKIYKTLSADASPSAIAFAVLFGLTLGFVPLTSGLGLFLIASILVIRVQVSSALLAMGVAKLVALAGVSRLFLPIGEAVLEPEGVHGFWTWLLNLPVVAWFDLDRPAVTGGALLGLGVGLLLFFPIVRMVAAYRRFLHDRLSGNRFFRWATNFWLLKGLRFVFIGTGVNA